MEAVHFVIPGCAVICLNQIRRFLSGVLYYVEKIDDRPSANYRAVLAHQALCSFSIF